MYIFRNDDVNPSTDSKQLYETYYVIRRLFPEAIIYSGVTVFGKQNKQGSVYMPTPFKGRELEWFYDIDSVIWPSHFIPGDIVSHGLFHIDHTKVDRQTQEMSIISSCRFLRTGIFVPPFNKYNHMTEIICEKNKINLIKNDEGWKSLDCNNFDPSHKKWYFHSWKFTPDELGRKLTNYATVL